MEIIFSSVVSFRPHIDNVSMNAIFEVSRLCTGGPSWPPSVFGLGVGRGGGPMSTHLEWEWEGEVQ